MKADTRQLEAIFDPNVFFQVPLFQRPYVWEKDRNWVYLWEDIQALLDKQLRNDRIHAHFLGAIVLEQLPHSAGSIETRLVIDGQQRFTTLQIFLIAARNLAAQHGSEKFSQRFAGLSENNANRVEKREEKYKLWPTNSDRDAFEAIHGAKSLKALDGAVSKKPEAASSKIVEGYRYFHQQISAWLDGKLDDDEDRGAMKSKTIDDRLDALWQVVKSGLQLVVINLDDTDETQVIFETLNARGTELLPADLIKNYLFRKAMGAKDEDAVARLYKEYWSTFETDFWREEVKQGRIKRPRIDLFINHYLTLMMREEVRSTHLFDAFKAFVENASPEEGSGIPIPSTPGDHIEQLSKYAEYFVKFYQPGSHDALKSFLRRLDAVDTATVYPFLLHAYATLMPDNSAEFDKVLAVLEAFLMRRLIVNWTTKNYNRVFVDLIRAVEKSETFTAEIVASHLAKGAGDSTKFPSDDDLRAAVVDQSLYGRIAQAKVRAVLEALDAYALTSKSEAIAMPKDLTIEHVMPQAWETYWPLPDEVRTDPVKEQKATLRRTVLLNSLGNLTLITGSFNSSLQHAAWVNKRPELLKYSKLNLTQYFHGDEAKDWNEAAISARTDHLLRQLCAIWPDVER
jgi:uncharacterized protein with ParB-like and HNH nuclease domain